METITSFSRQQAINNVCRAAFKLLVERFRSTMTANNVDNALLHSRPVFPANVSLCPFCALNQVEEGDVEDELDAEGNNMDD